MTRVATGVAPLILLIAAMAWLPQLVPSRYWLHVINLSLIYVPLAIGANIITGYCGMVSMGQAAFFGIGAYASALLSMRVGWPWPACFATAGLISAAAGMLVSLPCLRVRSDFLSLITIAFNQMVLVVANAWMDLTRGPMGLPQVPRIGLFGWEARTEADIFRVTAVVAGFCAWGAWRITAGPVGRTWEMIRDDEVAARALGVDVVWGKVRAFGAGCLMAGLAGSLLAHSLRLVVPDEFVLEQSLIIMQMAILGGLASIPGSVLGAVLMIGLPEALRTSEPWLMTYRPGIFGALLVAVMIWRPQGLLGARRAAPPILQSLSYTLRRALRLKPLARVQ
jgi:branched-chain amino acid transport system permease protein